VRLRRLGSTGPTVSALGLGCMGMSTLYGAADEAESIATIHAALDAGITLLDTGDYYAAGQNELLLRDALRGRSREEVVSASNSACSVAPAVRSSASTADPRRSKTPSATR
jgi:aryl-alcohol dehydrogenase-like predicted oxidoreductase